MPISSRDYRMYARDALRGRWLLAILVGLIVTLLCGTSDANGFKINLDLNTGNTTVQFKVLNQTLTSVAIGMFASLAFVAAVVTTIVTTVISGVLKLGYARFNLNLIDNTDPKMEDLLSQISRFGAGFCLHILTTIYTFLWSLLFIIPGYIASLKYSMAPFILCENPDMTASEAITASKELMDGHKMDLFVLNLSFIGWHILCAFTFGIGEFVLSPYIEAAHAAFYREIRDGKYSWAAQGVENNTVEN